MLIKTVANSETLEIRSILAWQILR